MIVCHWCDKDPIAKCAHTGRAACAEHSHRVITAPIEPVLAALFDGFNAAPHEWETYGNLIADRFRELGLDALACIRWIGFREIQTSKGALCWASCALNILYFRLANGYRTPEKQEDLDTIRAMIQALRLNQAAQVF